MIVRAGLGALEPRELATAAKKLPGRRACAAGNADVHPHWATLRPGRPAIPATHGGRRPHAR
jgi:hypothetical protein